MIRGGKNKRRCIVHIRAQYSCTFPLSLIRNVPGDGYFWDVQLTPCHQQRAASSFFSLPPAAFIEDDVDGLLAVLQVSDVCSNSTSLAYAADPVSSLLFSLPQTEGRKLGVKKKTRTRGEKNRAYTSYLYGLFNAISLQRGGARRWIGCDIKWPKSFIFVENAASF